MSEGDYGFSSVCPGNDEYLDLRDKLIHHGTRHDVFSLMNYLTTYSRSLIEKYYACTGENSKVSLRNPNIDTRRK